MNEMLCAIKLFIDNVFILINIYQQACYVIFNIILKIITDESKHVTGPYACTVM